MTKRENLKSINERIEDVGKRGYFALGISVLSLLFTLPLGEMVLGQLIDIQLWASIASVV
jgi:hypothetical protein